MLCFYVTRDRYSLTNKLPELWSNFPRRRKWLPCVSPSCFLSPETQSYPISPHAPCPLHSPSLLLLPPAGLRRSCCRIPSSHSLKTQWTFSSLRIALLRFGAHCRSLTIRVQSLNPRPASLSPLLLMILDSLASGWGRRVSWDWRTSMSMHLVFPFITCLNSLFLSFLLWIFSTDMARFSAITASSVSPLQVFMLMVMVYRNCWVKNIGIYLLPNSRETRLLLTI